MVGEMVREEYRRQAIELLARFTPMDRGHAGQLVDMLVALAHATAPVDARRQAHRSHAAFWSPDAPENPGERVEFSTAGSETNVGPGAPKGAGAIVFHQTAEEAAAYRERVSQPWIHPATAALPLEVLRERYQIAHNALMKISGGTEDAVFEAERALTQMGVGTL